jgi:hypothetical protein
VKPPVNVNFDLDETARAAFLNLAADPWTPLGKEAPTGIDLGSGFDSDLYYLPQSDWGRTETNVRNIQVSIRTECHGGR